MMTQLRLAFFLFGLFATVSSFGATKTTCDSGTTLSLLKDRFRITASTGTEIGCAVPLTSNSGAFWFDSPDNLDVIVKILDGTTTITRSYWLFYGTLTSRGYGLTVKDTMSVRSKTYSILPGAFISDVDFVTFPGRSALFGASSKLDFSVNPQKPSVGQMVHFSTESTARSFCWTFGDELPGRNPTCETCSASGPSTDHAFDSARDYTVSLSVQASDIANTCSTTGKTVTVRACDLTVSYMPPPPFPALGGLIKVTVTPSSSSSDCEWSATGEKFLKAVPPDSFGSGKRTITFQLDPNPNRAARNPILRIGGTTLTPVQKGSPCSYTLKRVLPNQPPQPSDLTQALFSENTGSDGQLSVMTQDGCAWSASVPLSSFVMLTGNKRGNGSGIVSYNVPPNPDINARQTILTIADKSFLVTQAGCSVSFDASALQKLSASESSRMLLVQASPSCSWTASSSDRFLTVLPGPIFTGTRRISLLIDRNTSSLPRTASLTIAGKTVSIRQPGCSSIDPARADFPAGRGMGTIHVTAPESCRWVAESNAGFVNVQDAGKVMTGSMTGPHDVVFTAESADFTRAGTLAVAGQMFIVTQQGTMQEPPACATLTGPTVAGMFGASGGVGHLSVSANKNCSWQVGTEAIPTFIQFNTNGKGHREVPFCVAANRGAQRAGRLALAMQSSLPKFFDILQEAPDGGDPTGPCQGNDPAVLCLHDSRFEAHVTFGDVPGARRLGQAVKVTDSTGYFWFFDPANPEVFVKILEDGSPQVFVGALTNLPYAVTIFDTNENMQGRTLYCNLDGKFHSSGELEIVPAQ